MRILWTGQLIMEQSPTTEEIENERKNIITRIAAHKPNMTIAELAKQTDSSAWYIFQLLLVEPVARPRYPQPGEMFKTANGTVLTVSHADRYAVHWEGDFFSTYDDLNRMDFMV